MDFKLFPDSILINALREGDNSAFREIYERHWKKMYLMAFRKLSDHEAVEGVVQDVFLRIWERRDRLEIDNLEAYLISSVKYACINQLKSAMVEERYMAFAYSESVDSMCFTDDHLNAEELMNTIDLHLKQFPERAQQIFRLARLENRTAKEISSQIKMPQRTVEYHLNLVVKALRSHLKDYF